MTYRTLGRTGVRVSPLTLGAMNFGARATADQDAAITIIHQALDFGINVIDTADVYSQGESEKIVGRALRGRRDDVVLATKFHGQWGDGVNTRGSSRRWIHRAVENSLRRLQTDHIDLYQQHKPDPDTDVTEIVGALDDLVRQGKIRYYGTTTNEPHLLVEAQWAADVAGRSRPATEQVPYSILARGAERASLPVAARYGLGVLTWSPLAGGWLSGRHVAGLPVPPPSARVARQPGRHDPRLPENQRKRDLAIALGELAAKAGLSLPQLAVAFVLRHPQVDSVIIGPRTPEHLESLLGVPEIVLDPEILDAIDELVPPGVTVNRADEGWQPPWLGPDKHARRRAVA
ncbi:aldo/keto reductase [Actinoplanes ianthinogenes]|uniref:Aldo/keto reductase n=1 Tax=Actinoplanes ianthinogenes TaxID=122358 RepID=A0ABM7M7N2_9ACTN|nr:aldo/keto reductase [Actinoplanes ianthinogenes]BCJ47668.1 aldo/keto reductase [Actinoplanes ianthinogenes]GGR03332.1 aldo/keto reductase [Actinoplanes ianthinogenes]